LPFVRGVYGRVRLSVMTRSTFTEIATATRPSIEILIVIAALEEIDSIGEHPIEEAMFLRQSARPDVAAHVFHPLRLSDSGERITNHRFKKIKKAKRYFPIRLNPPSKIIPKVR
jgi:hypothetical protein